MQSTMLTAEAAKLSIRAASPSDEDAVVELVYGNPGIDLLGCVPDRAVARRFAIATGRYRFRRERAMERTYVMEADHRAVGALLWAPAGAIATPVTVGLVWRVIRTLGVRGTLAMRRFNQLQQRVNPTPPDGSFYIAEVHVNPDYRNQGIGRRLLEHAETVAKAMGYPALSLITSSTNPARHLYERMGFAVTQELTDAAYEQLCGVPGRMLMVKSLSAV